MLPVQMSATCPLAEHGSGRAAGTVIKTHDKPWWLLLLLQLHSAASLEGVLHAWRSGNWQLGTQLAVVMPSDSGTRHTRLHMACLHHTCCLSPPCWQPWQMPVPGYLRGVPELTLLALRGNWKGS